MKKLSLIIVLLFISSLAFGQSRGGTPKIFWQEVDGSPSGRPRTIVVTNDVLTFNGNIMSLDVTGSTSATSPGGSNTQVQFNDGGSFAGDADLVWVKGSDLLVTRSLSVDSTATISGDVNIGINNFYVDNTNNRVGIGLDNPKYLLHARAPSNLRAPIVMTSSSGTGGISLNYANNSNTFIGFNWGYDSNGNLLSLNGNVAGGSIQNNVGDFHIYTIASTGVVTQRMQINRNTGYVSIGKFYPGDGILHLDNDTSDTDLIIEKDDGTNSDIIFHNAGVAAGHIAFDSNEDIVIENDTADKDIIFKILDGAADTEIMRIDGDVSRIGIGTINPITTLDVNGEISTDAIKWSAEAVMSPDVTTGVPCLVVSKDPSGVNRLQYFDGLVWQRVSLE